METLLFIIAHPLFVGGSKKIVCQKLSLSLSLSRDREALTKNVAAVSYLVRLCRNMKNLKVTSYHALPPRLIYSLTHPSALTGSLSRSLTHTHTHTHSLTPSLPPSLTHSLIHSLTHSLIHPSTPPTHPPTHLFTHLLTNSLTLTPPPPQSLIHVSSAYAQCNRQGVIEEVHYPTPVPPDKLIGLLE